MKLSEKEIQELKEKKISIEDLNDRCFINSQDEIEVDNILKLLNENICSFKAIADKFKSTKNRYNDPCSYKLLDNEYLFEELIQNNRLNKEDLRYLLNRIDNIDELYYLCNNTPLIKHILNEFVLNKETVDRLNTIVEETEWCERLAAVHNIFEIIERENQNNEEVLKLNELNKKVYLLNSFDLTKDQRDELIEVLRNGEIAKNRLIQIIENHLENTYDFDSLKVCLKKPEKKSLLNI